MICISLGSLTFDECIKAIGKFEYAEIRIDLLDFNEEQFKNLFSLKKNIIATCRPGKLNNAERLVKLRHAILSGAGFVDIEFESEDSYRNELVKLAHKNNTQVILSYHNFENTPHTKELEVIIDQSLVWDADYTKIATLANSYADNSRILGLYENHKKLIAFCMGKNGAITRLAAPLLGALFTFAAYSANSATAPGQLTSEQLLNLYYELGVGV